MLETFYSSLGLSFAVSAAYPIDRSRVDTVSFGVDVEGYRAFLDRHFEHNRFSTETATRRAGEIVPSRTFIPPEEFRRSDMYQEFHRPRDMGEGLRMDVSLDDDVYHSLAFFRPWSAGPYEADELALCRMLMPHMRRADALSRRMRRADLMTRSALATLDMLPHAIILLDDSSRVLHANTAANHLLSSAGGLDTRYGVLRATHLASASRLDAALARAAGKGGESPVAGSAPVLVDDMRPPLALLAMPFPLHAPWCLANRPAVLVCITDPNEALSVPIEHLAAVFDLTASEAKLANDLLTGDDLREIAARRGRTVHTVRTQLATLMAKTNVNRQSRLVYLLGRLPNLIGSR